MIGDSTQQPGEYYIDIRIAKQNLTPLISGYIHHNIYSQLDELAIHIEKFVHERRNFANEFLVSFESFLWKKLTVRQKVILDLHEKPPKDDEDDAILYKATAFIIEYWICKELPLFHESLKTFALPSKFSSLDEFLSETNRCKIENEDLIELSPHAIPAQKTYKSINRLKDDLFGKGNRKRGLFFWMFAPEETDSPEKPHRFEMKAKAIEGLVSNSQTSPSSSLTQDSTSIKPFDELKLPQITSVRHLKNITIMYSHILKIPLWTKQVLNLDELRKRDYSLHNNWNECESRSPFVSSNDDYVSSEFEKSPMIEHRYFKFDEEYYSFTFNIENAVPRHSSINKPGGLWYELADYLDKRACDYFIEQVFVYTGCLQIPCDGETVNQVIGKNNVSVPSHFYQIFIFNCRGKAIMECYLIPNRQQSDCQISLNHFLRPLKEIEKAAGYTVVTDFDRNKFTKVNGSSDPHSFRDQLFLE